MTSHKKVPSTPVKSPRIEVRTPLSNGRRPVYSPSPEGRLPIPRFTPQQPKRQGNRRRPVSAHRARPGSVRFVPDSALTPRTRARNTRYGLNVYRALFRGVIESSPVALVFLARAIGIEISLDRAEVCAPAVFRAVSSQVARRFHLPRLRRPARSTIVANLLREFDEAADAKRDEDVRKAVEILQQRRKVAGPKPCGSPNDVNRP